MSLCKHKPLCFLTERRGNALRNAQMEMSAVLRNGGCLTLFPNNPLSLPFLLLLLSSPSLYNAGGVVVTSCDCAVRLEYSGAYKIPSAAS